MRLLLGLAFVALLALASDAGRPGFAPFSAPSAARAAAGDDQFQTVAGANGKVWTGAATNLGTDGGPLPAQVSAVFQWENPAQAFIFWFRGFPANFNTLTTLATHGYYFFQAPDGVDFVIPNSAGYTPPAPVASFQTNAAGGATGFLWTGGDLPIVQLPAGVSAVFRWENSSQSFQFSFAGFPPSFNTLPGPLTAGQFYFLQAATQQTITVPPLAGGGSPTSGELIDAALLAGTLTPEPGTTPAETAIVYKLFADFGNPALPPQYQGAPPAAPEPHSLRDAADAYAGASDVAKALIDPYLKRPDELGSWANPGLAAGPRAPGIWQPVDGPRVRVWWNVDFPEDEAKATTLRDEMEAEIWDTLADLMEVVPLSDLDEDDNGGDGRVDIYLSPSTGNWGGYVPGGIWANGVSSPGYIVIARTLTGQNLLSTTAHEFMHLLQQAFVNMEPSTDDSGFLMESTATWSENFVYPSSTDEHDYLSTFYRSVRDDGSLDSWIDGDLRQYGAYSFFFYLTEKNQDPGLIREIWEAKANRSALEAIAFVLGGEQALRDAFEEFALYSLNGVPIDFFLQWDNITESSAFLQDIITFPVNATYGVDVGRHASFTAFQVPLENGDLERVTIEHSFLTAPATTRVRMYYQRNDTWYGPLDLSLSPSKTLCADGGDLQELVFLVTNSEMSASGPGTGQISVDATTEKCQWSAHTVMTYEDHYNGVVDIQTFTGDFTLEVDEFDPNAWRAVSGSVTWVRNVTGCGTADHTFQLSWPAAALEDGTGSVQFVTTNNVTRMTSFGALPSAIFGDFVTCNGSQSFMGVAGSPLTFGWWFMFGGPVPVVAGGSPIQGTMFYDGSFGNQVSLYTATWTITAQ